MLCCRMSLRAARHTALAAGSSGDAILCPQGDCFATLAMTDFEGICNRAQWTQKIKNPLGGEVLLAEDSNLEPSG